MVIDEVRADAPITDDEIVALFAELDAAEAQVRRINDQLRAANSRYMAREGYRGLAIHALRRMVRA